MPYLCPTCDLPFPCICLEKMAILKEAKEKREAQLAKEAAHADSVRRQKMRLKRMVRK